MLQVDVDDSSYDGGDAYGETDNNAAMSPRTRSRGAQSRIKKIFRIPTAASKACCIM